MDRFYDESIEDHHEIDEILGFGDDTFRPLFDVESFPRG